MKRIFNYLKSKTMKKHLLFPVVLSFMLASIGFSQLELQNPGFEDPDNSAKYRADGGGGFAVLNGNLPGWWADTRATDSGREDPAKELTPVEGKYTGFGYNMDGTIWNVAGVVEETERDLTLTYWARFSWAAAPAVDIFDFVAMFAVYEGEDTVAFAVVDSLAEPVDYADPASSDYLQYSFQTILPSSAVGKNLLIGYDVVTSNEGASNVWVNFDDFQLTVADVVGMRNINNAGIEIFPNPSYGVFTVKSDEPAYYSVFDIAGKKMTYGILNRNRNTIDLTTCEKGIYILEVRSAKETSSCRLVVK